ncbi:MAG: M23 family metallopeptidase [Bacteroidia bacterium]
MRLKHIFIGGLLLSTKLCGQSALRFPLDGIPSLTGNYAEIRPNHFHAGLDFKTDPKKNLPVYAVADGYVSRIKVSTHGYGKAIYVTHSNGLVSVYGHLNTYNYSTRKYTETAQTQQETFDIELFPKPNELKVKQGDLIGYSGNTGDSEGPHLHFELRDEKTEVPLNPLRFLKVADVVAPVIEHVVFYEDDYADPFYVKAKNKKDTISVGNKFGVGVDCYDKEYLNGSKNNIYKAELLLDDVLFYSHTLDSIAFDLARYVNTYCDYNAKKRDKVKIQKCFIGKNNDLSIYKTSANKGFFYLNDTLCHKLTVKVYDFYTQSAEVNVVIRRRSATKLSPVVVPENDCLKAYKKSTADYSVELPEKSLYTDVTMRDSFANGKLFLSAGWYDIPLQKSCTLSMKVPAQLLKFDSKLCLAEVSGKEASYSGGNFENGNVKTTTKNFGIYKVSLDTVAPKIKFVAPKKKVPYRTGGTVSFKVSDDFSGIGKFKLTLNDVFQLSEYEHKAASIFFVVKDETPKGKVKAKLTVEDKKGNISVYTTELLIK